MNEGSALNVRELLRLRQIGAFVLLQEMRCTEQQPGHMPREQATLSLPACFWRTPPCNHPAHGRAFAEVAELFVQFRE